MRFVFGTLFASLAVAALGAVPVLASDVEVKGPHICCPQCVNAVNKLMSKVDGVSNVNPDQKTKTVTFTAKDSAAAKAGFKALLDGGFFGSAKEDGKELKIDVAEVKKGDKAASVTVKDVHVCCGACQKAIKGIFADSKVSFEGTGAMRTVRVEGSDLYPGAVVEALKKGGFSGKLDK